ncbi:MAG: alpha/beta hydrolase-fold protein [Bacteroidota bacterium]
MKTTFIFLLMAIFNGLLPAQTLEIKLPSEILQREIEVFIYRDEVRPLDGRIHYFTDGRKVIENGGLQKIKKLIQKNAIPASTYVFVSSQDPDSKEDFRNEYFFNNPDYIHFFREELIPEVEDRLQKNFESAMRSLIGISFGGLNAAYFSAESRLFKNYALLSPVTYPRPALSQYIAFSQNTDLKIFISTGKNDAERYVGPLKELYESKNYEIEVNKTQGGHDFDNWNRQWGRLLNFLSD